jgi:hypothetical protein
MEFLNQKARRKCLKAINSDFEERLRASNVTLEPGPVTDIQRPRLIEDSDKFDYSNRVWEVVITEDMVSHLSKKERNSLFRDLWASLQWVSSDWGLDWDLNSKDPDIREGSRKFLIELRNPDDD